MPWCALVWCCAGCWTYWVIPFAARSGDVIGPARLSRGTNPRRNAQFHHPTFHHPTFLPTSPADTPLLSLVVSPPPVDPLLPPLHALFSLACAPVDTEIVHDIGCAFVTTTHGVSVPPAPRIRSPVATMAHTGAPRCCSRLWRSIPLYSPFCSCLLRPWLRVYLQPGC